MIGVMMMRNRVSVVLLQDEVQIYGRKAHQDSNKLVNGTKQLTPKFEAAKRSLADTAEVAAVV